MTSRTRRPALGTWLLYLAPFVVWMLYWVVFFPGLMNADSIHSWANVALGQYDESQTGFLPITYSWLMHVWYSPAVITLVQIVLMLAVLHYAYAVLRRLGAPFWLLACVAAYFTVSPFIATSLVTVVKDTPAGILLLLLLLFSIEILESGGAWLRHPNNVMLLAVTLALTCLVRHEGWISAVSFLGCLVLFFHRAWKPALAASALALGLVLVVQGPLFAAYHVNRNADVETVIMQCSQIAVVYNNDGVVTPSEAAFIDKIAPTASWKVGYDPYSLNNVMFFNPHFDLGFAYAHRAELASVWKAVAVRNWPILLASRKSLSAIAWSVPEPPGSFTYAVHLQAVAAGIDPNPYRLRLAHPLPPVERALRSFITQTSQPQWIWLFYRPALYLYAIAISCAALLLIRQKLDGLLLIAPLIGRIALIALFALSQDSRFFFYAFLLAPVMVAYTVTAGRRARAAA